ncbi:hypothetical protein VL15_18590 [Burkholderia cepacia]|uniref:Uncharacterized protein n=1 Tax=Burkholderia cepacia TaxID=292 RepID=A0A0J5WU90_BURCE|nr:hypothetical protein VL15_18590 [Burkholderia cepacia]
MSASGVRRFGLPERIVDHPGLITMSMRELDRLKVVEAVVEQHLMPWRAADGRCASTAMPIR